MATLRDNPYPGFNFVVEIDGVADGPAAGFQEVSGLGVEIDVIEYREGNSKLNSVIKLSGLARASDVHLKRGIVGSLELIRWLDDIRNGNGNKGGARNVSIRLLSEDRSVVAQSWMLHRARIIKYTAGPFNAQSSSVALEELVLACDRMDSE